MPSGHHTSTIQTNFYLDFQIVPCDSTHRQCDLKVESPSAFHFNYDFLRDVGGLACCFLFRSYKPSRIDVSTRLRRAIHLNDLTLVKRIIKNNPQSLQNPDFGDNGNTSLHLAAQLGLLEIAVGTPPPTPSPPAPFSSPIPL